MKKSGLKKTGMIAAALLLLAVLPVSSMAAKGTASRISTPSNAEVYSDEGELLDGDIMDDLTASPSDAEEFQDILDGAVAADFGATPTNAAKAKTNETAAEQLPGYWTVDGVTTYLFEEGGSGAMILPEHKYPFSWAAEGDVLTLQFEDSDIGEVEFTVSVSGDTLTMERQMEDGTAEFKFEKTDG